eukprot:tig00020554_g10891.t1
MQYEVFRPSSQSVLEVAGAGRDHCSPLSARICHVYMYSARGGASETSSRAASTTSAGGARRRFGATASARPRGPGETRDVCVELETRQPEPSSPRPAPRPAAAAAADAACEPAGALPALDEAVLRAERALMEAERGTGKEVEVAATELARLLRARGDLPRALRLARRAADCSAEPGAGAALHEFSLCLEACGDLAGATVACEVRCTPVFHPHPTPLSVLQRALAARAAAAGGPDSDPDPDTAASLHQLGRLTAARGEYAAALGLLERALAARERSLGPDHPATAATLHEIGRLHRSRGEGSAARAFYERALEIRRRAYGPEHASTAATMLALGEARMEAGDVEGARPLLEGGLRACEAARRAASPEAAAARRVLARLHARAGEPGPPAAPPPSISGGS